jgi:hypothetical protein
MSRKELVLLVSRAFALLLITWALVEVTYLPERVFALSHHLRQSSVLATSRDYWSSYYLMLTGFNVVRMLALFFAAVLFWRCGPGWRHFSRPSLPSKTRQDRSALGNCSLSVIGIFRQLRRSAANRNGLK